ncbi:MAG: MarR family transcriptional regulator [Candidatus Nanopelagicales bacterium]
MAKTQWLSHDEQEAWRSVMLMNQQLNAVLERGLLNSSGLSLADYGVLVTLSEAEGRMLQSRDIAQALVWEKSRLSHQVRRMESRGLVERVACETDARASMVRLTPEGLAVIEKAAPGHVELVRELFFDPISQKDAKELGRICRAISDQFQEANCDAEVDCCPE